MLHYVIESQTTICEYDDLDYACDLYKNKSIIRYVFLIISGAISWASKSLLTAAISTIKIGYVVPVPTSK